MVWGYEAYLVQLFTNLLSNAIKFSQRKPVVLITGEQIGNMVVIKLKDNGIGMNKENHERIFSPFQRLHGRSEYEGTGIGLAIVKKVVDVHRGKIAVESSLGEGTTFIIELPAENTDQVS
jgi:signal transduction histidine kinase